MAFGKPQKRFSQNFLTDQDIAVKIVGFLDLNKNDVVFEIGSGRGILTELIAATGARLVAFEIDRDLIESLSGKFAGYENVLIVNQDFLKVSPSEYHDGAFKLIGNIPYDITSPVIGWMMQYHQLIGRAVITAQRELAERIAAGPGGKGWAPISIFSQCHFEIRKVMTISPKSFFPPPKIVSATLLFEPRQDKPRVEHWDYFERTVRAAFQQRRKLLANNLVRMGGPVKADIVQILSEMGLAENVRAEQVTIEEFIQIGDRIRAVNIS